MPAPTAIPDDPMEGLRLAPLAKSVRRVTRDEYVTDRYHFLLRDAVARREAWMDGRAEGPVNLSENLERGLRAWSDTRGDAGAPVFFAGVWADGIDDGRPFDPAKADPKLLLARVVTAEGERVDDYDAGLLRRALRALGPVDRMTQNGLRNPLVLWRDGLVAGAVMHINVSPGRAAGRMVAGVPGHLPDVGEHAPGDGLKAALAASLGGGEVALGAAVARFAEAMGGLRERDGGWLLPTRVGPARLAADPGELAVSFRFARPRAASHLLGSYTSPTRVRVDAAMDVSPLSAATGEWHLAVPAARHRGGLAEDLATDALADLLLAPARRPAPAALRAEAARTLGPPPPPPGRGAVLGPGTRPVFVAMPAETHHGHPVPGVWQVLDRLRWRRLPGEGRRSAVDATVARLNAAARGP